MDSGVQRISPIDFYSESSGFLGSKNKSKQENIKWKHGKFQQLIGNIFRTREHYLQAKAVLQFESIFCEVCVGDGKTILTVKNIPLRRY